MKVLALIVCVGYLAVLAYGISDEYKEKVKTYHEECQANPATHLDKEMVKKLSKGEEVDKHKLQAHSLCMTRKLGIQKENGDVDKEGLKHTLAKGIDDETELKHAVDKCGTQKGTAEETAEELMKCFHKHVGRHIYGEHHDDDSDEHHVHH